ncbi:hypothetical protein ACIQRS_25525 [Streptomyces termitum]|uniref:Uncharacterized protein n=1 Tax=Streptomyces termitum TaxID=67368 RepID=A0A918WBG1_9ACTN|nr:hypothetical protein [Streptomyces termitum]GHB07378.1 hypothetical protein GCM10010305_58120 [Streptomyces termitum]
MILLLGAGPDDPAVDSFDGYLTRRSIDHAVCRDPGRLPFAVRVDPDGRTRVRLRPPGHGTLDGDEVAVFVRDPSALVPPDPSGRSGPSGPDARFAADEYRAALWSLCAFLPRVVNRPGPRAWPDAADLRRRIAPSSVLPERWTTDGGELLDDWRRSPAAELHVEDLLTRERRIVRRATDPGAGEGEGGTGHLRALFAPSSAYVIELCVGRRSFTVLNEPGVDVTAAPYRAFVRDLAAVLRGQGLRFFAAALVADERRWPLVSRVVPVPPFSWYRDIADEVHGQLCAELGHGPRAGTGETR